MRFEINDELQACARTLAQLTCVQELGALFILDSTQYRELASSSSFVGDRDGDLGQLLFLVAPPEQDLRP